jgi:hypothetical protein
MTYSFNLSNGFTPVTVPTGNIKTTYSLGLVGRNTTDYGLTIAKNTVHHLENFAHTSAPSGSPLVGQLWYDSSESLIRVYDGSDWKRSTSIPVQSGNTHLSGNLVAGTAYFNTNHDQLFVYDGNDFQPAVLPGGNVTNAFDGDVGVGSRYGAKVETLYLTEQGDPTPKAVMAIKYVHNGTSNQGYAGNDNETVMAILSDHDSFAVANTDPYYAQLANDVGGIGVTIGKGLTLRSDYADSTVENANVATYASFSDAIDTASPFVSNTTVISGGDIFHWKRDLIPGQTETYNIGSNSAKYNEMHVADIVLGGASAGSMTFNTTGVTIGTLSTPASHIYAQDLTVKGDLNMVGVNELGTVSDPVESAVITDLTLTTGTISTTASNNTDIANKLFVDNAISVAALDYVQLSGTDTQTITYNTTFNTPSAVQFNSISGASATFSGTVSGGTLTDGAMNITSGAITGGTSATFSGAVSGGTGSFGGTLTGGTVTDGTLSINSGSITSGVAATFSGTLTSGTVTDGTMSINGGAISGGVSAIFSGTVTADTFSGVATEAQYADLAEIYSADAEYEPGTVVKIGGDAEITQTTEHADVDVFGVISTAPAYLMNKDAEGLPVALQGRVPVKVIGKIKKGERLVSSDVPGVAWALGDDAYNSRAIIGRALQSKEDGDAGVIEAVIGVK